jgi:hypothetical protein
VFGSYTPGTTIKLDEICKIIGLPGKPSGIDGSEVEAMVQAGRIAEVAQYCESDILNTYGLWLVYELFRGSINAEQLAFSETQAADFVQTRKSDNAHLAIKHGPASGTGKMLSRHSARACASTLACRPDKQDGERIGEPDVFVRDHLQPCADRGVERLAGVKQLDGELHRLPFEAAPDAFLERGQSDEQRQAVLRGGLSHGGVLS